MSKTKDAYDLATETFLADARRYAASLIETGDAVPGEEALRQGFIYARRLRKRDAELLASLPAPSGNVVPIRQ